MVFSVDRGFFFVKGFLRSFWDLGFRVWLWWGFCFFIISCFMIVVLFGDGLGVL